MSTTTTSRIDVSDEDYQDLAAHLRGVLDPAAATPATTRTAGSTTG